MQCSSHCKKGLQVHLYRYKPSNFFFKFIKLTSCSVFPPLPQARTGIVMNIIGILCITLSINTWGKAMFELDSFPVWANATGV